MAAHVCPQCNERVPARCSVAFSDGFDCPHCKTRLQVAGGSRGLAVVAGLVAGGLAWRFSGGGRVLGMVLPELYALLAFGVVSPLVLMGIADLRVAQTSPAEQALPVGHAAGGGPH